MKTFIIEYKEIREGTPKAEYGSVYVSADNYSKAENKVKNYFMENGMIAEILEMQLKEGIILIK